MTCYTRCGNGCCPNTPNPIWVFGQCNQGSNNVVNPITALSYGYFQAPTTGEVTTNTAIPLTLTTSRGTLITSGGADSVSLDAGTYLITYSVNALVPASGTLSTSLQLNGATIDGSTATTTATGTFTNTKTIVLVVPQTSTLTLVNSSTDTITVNNANLTVQQL